jgi:hypothetical protein
MKTLIRRRILHALRLFTLALALCAAGCMQAKMSETEKDLILRAQDLAPYGFEVGGTSKHESFTKTVYFDKSYELEYEYEVPDGSGLDPLYLNVSISFEETVSDAKMTRNARKMGLSAGSYLNSLKLEEKNDFFKYGDESSYYVLLSKNNVPGGSYFVTREGTRVYSLIVAGAVFDDPEMWAELVMPKLQKFSAHGR